MSQGRIISFRVADEHYALLTGRSVHGGSPGSYARELMLQSLYDETVIQELRLRMDQQGEQLNGIQREIRTALLAALITFARLDPERARKWVGSVVG